tara:strand:- start:60636 stop:61700 length:1065 start_codon:yes stop_codon:yes gene_type:complete
MSGTSLDGIDVAEINLSVSSKPENASNHNTHNDTWKFDICAAETIQYTWSWKDKLQNAINFSEENLKQLDISYTKLLAEVILKFIQKHNVKNIDAVCSHGHTILHQPERGLTYQIGNLPQLARLLNQRVVCNFRVQDVKLGGQGAPLVPIGDKLLFSDFNFCLNLGGFANCSFKKNDKRIAFDICPVNIVLNKYAEKLGFNFDEGGKIAASGRVDKALLQKLNMLPYYREKPPKSLGLEWVKKEVFPLLNASNLLPQDVLRTYTEHIAVQLTNQFKGGDSILITGGGAYNTFLIERLMHLAAVKVNIPSPKIVEYKEALIFGLLGVLKLRDEINCLAGVTGALKDHSSGEIFIP